jgi:Protein kinase domain
MSGLAGYEMRRQIGWGSSGTVWEAVRRGPISQVVAVKRLRGGGSSDEVAQLRREAMVLTELDHPHIVRVLEVLEDGDGVAICMQYAPGGSLEAMLAERGRLDPGEVVAVAVPIAEALSSAHRRGVLHVDVKPANILFTSDSEPLLGDFGVARTLGRLTAVLGGHGPIAGTAHYLAPELLDGSAPDPRSDVYSLAVVCYEALTGKRPFDAAAPLAVLRAADAGSFEPLTSRPGIPAPLARLVEQAMARDPDLRIDSAGRFAWELRVAVPQAQVRLPGILAALEAQGPATAATTGPPEPLGAAGAPGTAGAIGTAGAAGAIGTAGAAGSAGASEVEPAPAVARPVPAPAAVLPPGYVTPTMALGEIARRETRTFGPRPPAPSRARPERRSRLRPVVLPVAVVAVAGVALVAILVAGPLGSDAGCLDEERPTVEAGTQVVAGDPEGDGCIAYGVYALDPEPDDPGDMFLTIEVGGEERRLRLGELGDRMFLGDWDCDGVDTPGVYRWTQGEVEYYGDWPASDDDAYRPADTEQVPSEGRATVDLPETDGDCERLDVVAAAPPGEAPMTWA